MTFARLGDHTVLLSAISPDAIVIDAGFNKGDFTTALLAKVQCRVIALEPFLPLAENAVLNTRIVLSQKALAETSGRRYLHEFDGHCASLHLHSDGKVKNKTDVQTVTIAELMEQHGIDRLHLLKLDIEGEEIHILETIDDDTLQKIDQITVEFHFSLFPSHEVAYKRICRRLLMRGFYCMNFSTRPGTDTLFIQKRVIPGLLPFLKLWSAKYRLGLRRILDRRNSCQNRSNPANLIAEG